MKVAVFELNLPLESSTATEYDISRFIPRGHCCELSVYSYNYSVPAGAPIRLLSVVKLLFSHYMRLFWCSLPLKQLLKSFNCLGIDHCC